MRITTNGTTSSIPDDEPVFLIRGQDVVGAAAVRAWADLAAASGADPQIVSGAREHAEEMDAWLKKKVADLPTAGATTFCGFPQSPDGTVQGALPDDAEGADHSDALEELGYQIHVARSDDLDDDASDWQPTPPKGDGWTLAWKAQDEDGWNAVWWRPTAQQKLEKLATMVLGLGLVSSGGKVVKDYARGCLGIERAATGV